MGFFSFVQEIAMDLGTANTIIISDDKIVVDEPSVVALDRRTDKMIAVGEKAKMMYEKTHDNIRTIRPLRDGVIADFTACEQMMRGLIKMVHTGSRLFSPSLRMVIGVPSGSTEVELRAVRDSAEHADGRDVYLIFEPMAAAIGIGIDVEAPEGNMIVDIGGGTTEIAVISLGGIVANNSIKVAGDDLTADCQRFVEKLQQRGGIDLLVLGLGENGHLGFNQPGTPFERTVGMGSMDRALEARIRRETNLPAEHRLGGVTLGLSDIMQARRIILVVKGTAKAKIVSRVVSGPVSTDVPASILQHHPHCEVLLDADAATFTYI